MPLVCLLTIGLSACEEDVTVVTGTDLPFSLFGVLTPEADTQFVRVFAIEGQLSPIENAPLDARFTSQVLETGEERVWRDSLIQEANGQFSHVYWSPFTAVHARTYRLDVERSDGARTSVEAKVPPMSEMVLPAQAFDVPGVFPVVINGEVPNLLRIEVTYGYKYLFSGEVVRDAITFVYDGAEEKVVGGWFLSVNAAQDRIRIQSLLKEALDLDTAPNVKLVRLTIRMIAANLEWEPPEGNFDLDVLVQPGTLSNVENGFGFVGAGYRLEGEWVPFDTLLVDTGVLNR